MRTQTLPMAAAVEVHVDHPAWCQQEHCLATVDYDRTTALVNHRRFFYGGGGQVESGPTVEVALCTCLHVNGQVDFLDAELRVIGYDGLAADEAEALGRALLVAAEFARTLPLPLWTRPAARVAGA